MARKKRILLDTSAINRLHDDPSREQIMQGLKSEFRVRLNETNVGEVFGTTKTERRISLMTLCRECLTFGDCLLPHQEIITKMAITHSQMGQRFRWHTVDVTVPKFANAVLQEDVWRDEQLSEEQRESLSETADKFLKVLRESREKFKGEYEKEKLLPDLTDVRNILKADGGGFWKSGAGLYERATGIRLGERKIKRFLADCPPFHAVAFVSVIGLYQYGIPKDHTPSKYRAHFYDLLMGCHLPYCDVFVTHEKQQQNALEVIAQEIGVYVKCLSWEDFSSRLLGRTDAAKS